MNPNDKLYQTAKGLIGHNLAPGNEKLGCAISLSAIYNKAFNEHLRFTNTTQWYDYMKSSPLFYELEKPEEKCIIVSVTSQIPSNSPLSNGHIGQIGKYTSPDGSLYIMSNDSNEGYWNTQFTVKKWNDYFIKYGRVPTYYFKLV